MLKLDSLIFDLDGTLWDSTDGIIETWNELLKGYPEIDKVVTREEMASNFGRPLPEIARRMFPDQTPQMQMKLMDECGDKEIVYLSEHGGSLYPRTEEVLKALSAKMPLFIVSNCQAGYIESFYKGNGMGGYFKDHECIGVTGLSKGENIRLIIERNGLKNPAYMGDTQGDADAARAAGVPFIYAAYGFGEVDGCDEKAEKISDLLHIIE